MEGKRGGRMKERELLVWYHEQGVPQNILSEVRSEYGSLESFLGRSPITKKGKVWELLRKTPSERDVSLLKEELDSLGIFVDVQGDTTYPEPLLTIPDAPLLLYRKGEYSPSDRLAIGVVGSRKCTPYGAWACEKIVRELCKYDVTVISGLALGIDRIAHESALAAGSRTIGVLGNGLRTVYPASHRSLYPQVENNGCIFSDFPSWASPLPHHFPFRNRIIAGLSIGLLVIEAKEKSGTMSTASHALSQGKDVFAVPGNVNSLYSVGCNQLIKEGAVLTTSADDILEQIAEFSMQKRKQKEQIELHISEEERSLVDFLKEKPTSVDELVDKLGIPVHEVHMLLTLLEMRGVVSIRSGLCFLVE